MARIIFTLIMLIISVQLSFSQVMNVHTNSGVDEYNISDIDSITFTIIDTTNLNVGLMAYYPFNGNANDESGNRNHGTIDEVRIYKRILTQIEIQALYILF